MALPDTIRIQQGTAVVWADTTDYSSSVSGLTRTDQIDLTSVADAAARQGAKADLGATRAEMYLMIVGIEFAVAPTSGEPVEFYWAESPSATAGNANPGGTGGSDAAYTGTAGDSLADSVLQLVYVGNLIATADATTTVQYQTIGVISPTMRYGMPVVKNESGQALVADAVEQYVALIPMEGVVSD